MCASGRTRARLRKTLVDERTAWHQRIRATLYHHGISGSPEHLSTLAGREFLAKQALPIDATERITIALEMIDLLEIQIARVESEIRTLARRQTGCKALMTLYGMGELTSLITLTELGDVSRMHASRQAVRCAGIDVGVHRSDRTARVGSSPTKDRPNCAGRCMKPRNPRAGHPALTTTTTRRSKRVGCHTPQRR